MKTESLLPARTILAFTILCGCLVACTSDEIGFRSGQASSSLPRMSSWTCSGGARLAIANQGAVLRVEDSRGVSTDLPPDPPGQRTRYGKTGFALVLDGRRASWFVSGKRPADCTRS